MLADLPESIVDELSEIEASFDYDVSRLVAGIQTR